MFLFAYSHIVSQSVSQSCSSSSPGVDRDGMKRTRRRHMENYDKFHNNVPVSFTTIYHPYDVQRHKLWEVTTDIQEEEK